MTDHETQLRAGALATWGEARGLVPEEIERLQGLEPALQDVATRGFVFVEALVNHYHCAACDETWSDTWCCACDDECPGCGGDFSPEESEVVGVEIIQLKSERCSVCGETHEF